LVMSYLAHRRKYFQIPGCVAYYTLNEASGDALDSVAGNDGTPSGVTYGATGKIGDAYTFDGVNDYVNIDAALTPLASTTVGTWNVWVKPVDATPSNGQSIISFGDTNANERILLFRGSTNGRLKLFLSIAGVTQWYLDCDTLVFSEGVWTMATIVQDGSPKIYLDGILKSSTFITDVDRTKWIANCTGLDNGRLSNENYNNIGETDFGSQDLDEVGLFDTALSAAQVLELYNSGTGKTYPF
jgi:hypothetical protein